MKGKAIIPLALGLFVGLMAVKFLVGKIQDAKGSSGQSNIVQVVRARMDIDAFSPITEELIEVIETEENPFTPEASRFSNLEDVVGRVTSKAIPKESPVLNSMLAPKGTVAGVRGRIKKGYRAVAVKIDEMTGVGYQLQPGDWVDVIVVMDVKTGVASTRKRTVAEVILQHVEILAVGRMTTGATEPGVTQTTKPAKSATLAVLEKDAPKLHLASTRGKITLSMRGNDSTVSEKPILAVDNFGAPPQDIEVIPNNPIPTPAPAPVRVVKMDRPFTMTIWEGGRDTASRRVHQTTFEGATSRNIINLTEGPIKARRLPDE